VAPYNLNINLRIKIMESFQKAIVTIVLFLAVLVYGFTHMLIPYYPSIDDSYENHYVNQFIVDSVQHEINIYQRESLPNGTVTKDELDEFNFALKEFGTSMNKCKNDKGCLIGTYNNFMSDNVSDLTRKTTRYKYMRNLGFIGDQINESFSWTY